MLKDNELIYRLSMQAQNTAHLTRPFTRLDIGKPPDVHSYERREDLSKYKESRE